MAKRARELYEFSCKYTNAVHEGPTLMTLSKPNYHPKDPPPNTIALGVRTSIYELGGGRETNSVQSKGMKRDKHRLQA